MKPLGFLYPNLDISQISITSWQSYSWLEPYFLRVFFFLQLTEGLAWGCMSQKQTSHTDNLKGSSLTSSRVATALPPETDHTQALWGSHNCSTFSWLVLKSCYQMLGWRWWWYKALTITIIYKWKQLQQGLDKHFSTKNLCSSSCNLHCTQLL